MANPLTVPAVRTRKKSHGCDPIVMITAYDAPSARMADEAGTDLILVGDTVAMVVLGFDDTLQISVDDIAYHTAAVTRTNPAALVIADLPWMSYHVSIEETVHNAAKLIRSGAQAVKLEGGRCRLSMIEALLVAEIPVMGHLGLTPQSVHSMGGFKIQARDSETAAELVEDAKALAHAGCFSIVLEGIPISVAQAITDAIDVPTIGIGAGPDCDGQVLVFHDLLGIEQKILPKFVRRYADFYSEGVEGLRRFSQDVRSGSFPSVEETYGMSDTEVLRICDSI